MDSQIYTLMIFIISTLSYTGIFILAPIEHRNNPLTLREIKKYKKISRREISMRNIILKTLKKSSYLAMFVAVLSANTTCTWIVHQPSMPKDLKKLKKI